jgi:hypothetical protein
MPNATLRLIIQENGTLIVPTSVELESEGADYGLRRVDNWVEVTASGTAFTNDGKGNYSHSFNMPAPNLAYEYRAKIVTDTETRYAGGTIVPSSDDDGTGEESGENPVVESIIVFSPSISGSLTDYLSSEGEVLRIMGDYAIDLLLEDVGRGGNAIVWNEVLEEATETTDMYTTQFYNPATHRTNKWLRRKTTVLAAHLISQRRGNNPLFNSRVDRVYEEFALIASGGFHIPNSIPRGRFAPVVRNYTIQNRMQRHPQRVDTTKSTGTAYAGMDAAIEPYVFSRQL